MPATLFSNDETKHSDERKANDLISEAKALDGNPKAQAKLIADKLNLERQRLNEIKAQTNNSIDYAKELLSAIDSVLAFVPVPTELTQLITTYADELKEAQERVDQLSVQSDLANEKAYRHGGGP